MTPISRVSAASVSRTCRSALAAMLLAAGVAGTALAQTPPSAAEVAVAKDVVLASGISRSFDQVLPRLNQQIVQTLTRTRPEIADDLTAILKQLQPEFQARQSELVDEAAQIFAKNMSEQELKDTDAFFNSPSGKKYVDSQPAIVNEIVGDMSSWTRRLSGDLMDRVRVELKKKGHDL